MIETIETKNLSAAYGTNQILKDVSIIIPKGKITCLCGPNGCGKSTLLSLMSSVYENNLKITNADINPSIKNDSDRYTEISSLKRKECARTIAYLQQSEYSMWNFTVKDIVLSGRFAYTNNGFYSKEDYDIVNNILAKTGLSDFSERFVHQLSGGEYQKVRIARSLAQQPDFLILDEPNSSLDYVFEKELFEILRKEIEQNNTGIILSIHDINTASVLADQIILLPFLEKPICGSPKDVLTEENLRKTYKSDFSRVTKDVWTV